MKWKNILNLTLKTSILICWMLYIIDFFTLIIRIPFKDLVVYVYEVVYDVVHMCIPTMQCNVQLVKTIMKEVHHGVNVNQTRNFYSGRL